VERFSPEAEAAHLARQRSVSFVVKPGRVVVLSRPVAVTLAVAVVGSGVAVVQVSGLGSLLVLEALVELGFRGVRGFATGTAVSAGDGMEILQREKKKKKKKIITRYPPLHHQTRKPAKKSERALHQRSH